MTTQRCCGNRKALAHGIKNGTVILKGDYPRDGDGRRIRRYQCKVCGRGLSSMTYHPTHGQKRRLINHKIEQLLCSGMSQRRISKILHVDRKTVARRFIWLAEQARLENERLKKQITKHQKIDEIWLDEAHTQEQYVWQRLSVPVIVTKKRFILSAGVCEMRDRKEYRKKSEAIYGKRKDEQAKCLTQLLRELRPFISPGATLKSDCAYFYPGSIKRSMGDMNIKHKQYQAKKPSPNGLGEMKCRGFDPLFPVNQVLAMMRENINRLARQTWCTTKRRARLEQHLQLFIQFHNRHVLRTLKAKGEPAWPC